MPSAAKDRVLVTGVTGQVAAPIARALAHDHEVWGLARLRAHVARDRLEQAGVTCVGYDLSNGDPLPGELPRDFTVVAHFAVVKSGRFARDLAANGEGVGRIMSHCRGARAFLHCSTTAVYAPNGGLPMSEDAPLGDHHRSLMPTCSIAKIAAKIAARFAAVEFGVPTVIPRLNVPYGAGGWPAFHLAMLQADQPIPVHPDGSVYTPIHDDDLARMVPRLLEVAAVPATTVNWAGPESVGIEEWSTFLGELAGVRPRFVVDDDAVPSARIDTTRMEELLGPARVGWRNGFTRLFEVATLDA